MQTRESLRSRSSRKRKKPFYKKWWVWVVTSIVLLGTITLLLFIFRQNNVDYSAADAEAALDSGKNIEGKTVRLTVKRVVKTNINYDMEAERYLNFVSSDNPNVKKGDIVVVRIKRAREILGSYIITYTKM